MRGHDAAGHTQDPDLGLPQRGWVTVWPRAGRRSTTTYATCSSAPRLTTSSGTGIRRPAAVSPACAYTGTHPDPGYGLIAKLRVVQPELEMLPPDAASIELPQT